MFTVPTSTAASVVANVSSLLADPGLLTIVVLAVGIPLGFYVLHLIIGLFPKARSKRQ